MKHLIFSFLLIGFSTSNFAQNINGIFVFKAINSDKALDISTEKNTLLKTGTQSVKLNDACITCKSQQWRVYQGTIVNISNGKFLDYNSTTKQLELRSSGARSVWTVRKESNGKIKIELNRIGCLSTINPESKATGTLSLGYPCNNTYDMCDAISWDITELEFEVFVPQRDLGTFCPSVLINGDREFNGNGPQISGSVSLALANNNTEVIATIFFEAIETGGDVSRTKQTWEKIIYTAPRGKKILSFLGTAPVPTTFFFISAKAGFVADRLIKGDIVHTNRPLAGTNNQEIIITGNVVNEIEIIGDTAGPDISDDTNCNDDTRIKKLILNGFSLKIVTI